MTRVLALSALVVAFACKDPEAARETVEQTAERAQAKVVQTAERAQELGDKAAERVEDVAQDVAEKTAADAEVMARETAEEARRVAGKAAVAADQATDKIDEKVDDAGERVKNTAAQAADVAVNGVPTPAPAHEVREVMVEADHAIDCDGKGRCTVHKSFAERLRAQPEVVVAQARVEPAPSGGVKLSSLGDLPTKLGFENGDVVTSVNGVDLAREDAMAELVLQLGGSHFEIQFVRRGTEQTLQIDVV